MTDSSNAPKAAEHDVSTWESTSHLIRSSVRVSWAEQENIMQARDDRGPRRWEERKGTCSELNKNTCKAKHLCAFDGSSEVMVSEDVGRLPHSSQHHDIGKVPEGQGTEQNEGSTERAQDEASTFARMCPYKLSIHSGWSPY